jgi:hypothetical protein
MMRLRHLVRLFIELCSYSVVNESVWVLFFVLALLMLSGVAIVSQTALPYIYTLF